MNLLLSAFDNDERIEVMPKDDTVKEDKTLISKHPDNGNQCDCSSCVQSCSSDSMKEGDEQRQSAIEFEDEIQDYAYVKDPKAEAKPEDNNNKNRLKREAPPKFPDETNKNNSRKEEVEEETTMVNGEYQTFITTINDSTTTSFFLGDLHHFTNFKVQLKVCREKVEHPNDIAEECSTEITETYATLKKESNDLITEFNIFPIGSNGSTSIKVTWEAPKDPNGLILSYTIEYRKVDEHSKSESKCVPQQYFVNQSYYILTHLTSGNYSVRMAATSMAGKGNYTAAKYLNIEENSNKNLLITGGIIFLVAVTCILIFLFITWKRLKMGYITNMKLIANVNPDYAGVHYKQDGWEVPRDKILQLQELGQGSFGMVYEGIIKDLKLEGGETRCAIKTVNENATDKERISFLNEASVMKQFDTAFVVRLLGVVSQTQPTFVVMELMTNGDLKSYLRSHRSEYDNGTDPPLQPPTLRQILQMSAEIADGMSYLSAKKFVHRDLAARNCMVAEDLTVKIGDFGMTRDIYETDYYR